MSSLSVNGYLHDAVDKQLNFAQFMLLAARAYGACVTMRDDPWDAPIPETFEPGTYHVERLAEAEAEFKRLSNMTRQERERFGVERRDRKIALYQKMQATERAEVEMLMKLKAEVENWKPPTPEHEGMKRDVLGWFSHVEVSSYYAEMLAELERSTPLDHYSEAVKECTRNIAYHTKEHKQEVERCKSRTEWIAALRKSLEPKGNT